MTLTSVVESGAKGTLFPINLFYFPPYSYPVSPSTCRLTMDGAMITDANAPWKLCIAQYWRGHHSNGSALPLHWALFAISNLTPEPLAFNKSSDLHEHLGTCFQVIGNTINYEFSCTEECMEVLADEYRGCLHVGNVIEEELSVVKDILSRVQVYRHREDWNCQNWVLAAVERLKQNGSISANVTANGIRNELEDMWRHWES